MPQVAGRPFCWVNARHLFERRAEPTTRVRRIETATVPGREDQFRLPPRGHRSTALLGLPVELEAPRSHREVGERQGATGLLGLGVSAHPDEPPHLDRRRPTPRRVADQVDPVKRQRADLLSPQPGGE